MKLDATEEEIKEYLDSLKRLICDPDTQYTLKSNRDKNYIFTYVYKITKEKSKEIICSIKPSEFYEKIKNTNPNYHDEILYAWNPIRSFIDASGNKREIELYIKTYINKRNKVVVVVSFHEFNDFS